MANQSKSRALGRASAASCAESRPISTSRRTGGISRNSMIPFSTSTQPFAGRSACSASSTTTDSLPSLQRRSGGARSVVSRTTNRIDPYISSFNAPTFRPMVAKMSPTSPRGNMPKPITSLSLFVPSAPSAAAILPMMATAESRSAMAITRISNIAERSVVIPMYKKKTGTKILPSEATSRSTRSCALIRRSARPATNAPMIGARFALSARTENASATPIAITETVAVERLCLVIVANIFGKVANPITEVRMRKPKANPIVVAIVPMPTEPCSTIRTTTVRMMRPRTSSTTAAPSTVRASAVANARKSPNTRAVIPMLVAVSAAPMNNDVLVDSPIASPTPTPSAIGNATPMSATSIEARPTLRNSATSVSRPT